MVCPPPYDPEEILRRTDVSIEVFERIVRATAKAYGLDITINPLDFGDHVDCQQYIIDEVVRQLERKGPTEC